MYRTYCGAYNMQKMANTTKHSTRRSAKASDAAVDAAKSDCETAWCQYAGLKWDALALSHGVFYG